MENRWRGANVKRTFQVKVNVESSSNVWFNNPIKTKFLVERLRKQSSMEKSIWRWEMELERSMWLKNLKACPFRFLSELLGCVTWWMKIWIGWSGCLLICMNLKSYEREKLIAAWKIIQRQSESLKVILHKFRSAWNSEKFRSNIKSLWMKSLFGFISRRYWEFASAWASLPFFAESRVAWSKKWNAFQSDFNGKTLDIFCCVTFHVWRG